VILAPTEEHHIDRAEQPRLLSSEELVRLQRPVSPRSWEEKITTLKARRRDVKKNTNRTGDAELRLPGF
jgi:hypothetical protein